MRKAKLNLSGIPESSRNIKKILRPRLEYKHEEGFNGIELKKALLESLYEKEKQDKRQAADYKQKSQEDLGGVSNDKRKKDKKHVNILGESVIPSTEDFIRFISLDYSNDTSILPKDLRQFRSLPLKAIPNPQ